MQRDPGLVVDAAQVPDHAHVQPVVAQRPFPVFGLHQVDPDEAGIALGELESEQQLREHHGWRLRPAHLEVLPDDHRAPGVGMGGAAAQQRP